MPASIQHGKVLCHGRVASPCFLLDFGHGAVEGADGSFPADEASLRFDFSL